MADDDNISAMSAKCEICGSPFNLTTTFSGGYYSPTFTVEAKRTVVCGSCAAAASEEGTE
jgi:hypothetical protein